MAPVSKATIADVARAAGVSTATAGRVLGGYGHTSGEKKEQVLKAAQALGLAACSFDLIVDQRGEPYILEANIRSMIGNMSFPHPAGRWNLDVPRALLRHFVPTNRITPRRVTGSSRRSPG